MYVDIMLSIASSLRVQLKILFNIVDARFNKTKSWIMMSVVYNDMFRRVNKQPGIQSFEIYVVTIKNLWLNITVE